MTWWIRTPQSKQWSMLSTYLGSLEPDEIESLGTQLERVVRHAKREKWPEDVIEFLADFLENFGVGNDDED